MTLDFCDSTRLGGKEHLAEDPSDVLTRPHDRVEIRQTGPKKQAINRAENRVMGASKWNVLALYKTYRQFEENLELTARECTSRVPANTAEKL